MHWVEKYFFCSKLSGPLLEIALHQITSTRFFVSHQRRLTSRQTSNLLQTSQDQIVHKHHRLSKTCVACCHHDISAEIRENAHDILQPLYSSVVGPPLYLTVRSTTHLVHHCLLIMYCVAAEIRLLHIPSMSALPLSFCVLLHVVLAIHNNNSL